MKGKNKIDKELSSLGKGLHIGNGYDGEIEVSREFGTNPGTRGNVSGRPLESKRSGKDLLDSDGEKLLPRELTPSEVN